MDAIEFIRERNRMCDSFSPDCEGCPIDEAKPVISECFRWTFENPEKAVCIVEKWSAEHPRKTRQSEFLRQWPEAVVSKNGYLGICPAYVSSDYRTNNGRCENLGGNCNNCKRKFWRQEVE